MCQYSMLPMTNGHGQLGFPNFFAYVDGGVNTQKRRLAHCHFQPSAKTASASRLQYKTLPTETTPSFGR